MTLENGRGFALTRTFASSLGQKSRVNQTPRDLVPGNGEAVPTRPRLRSGLPSDLLEGGWTVTRRIWALSIATTALVALGAIGFLSASAPNTGGSGPSGPGGSFPSHWRHGLEEGQWRGPLLHRLNLSDAQRTQIQTILAQECESAGALYQQLDSDKVALSDKFFAAGASQSADPERQVRQLVGGQ